MIYTNSTKKILLTVAIIFLCASIANAQRPFDKSPYHVAIGAKYYALGVSVKVSSGQGDFLEGQAFKTANSIRLGMLYEIHRSINDGLSWYTGGGLHLDAWDQNWKYTHQMYGSDASIGFDGIIGLDYKTEDSPIDITLDWQPAFILMGQGNGRSKFNPLFGGISVRLAL